MLTENIKMDLRHRIKNNAQDEMKRIRKSAMQKWSKEIPYNSIEDW